MCYNLIGHNEHVKCYGTLKLIRDKRAVELILLNSKSKPFKNCIPNIYKQAANETKSNDE